MRYDMAKVIVERPRRGGGVRYPRGRSLDGSKVPFDESRKREGMRRPWFKGCAKSLNENLAPLHRYLQANVGRPWNKVYSEVCERINRDSAVQYHVWQHLMMDVCTDPHVVLGQVRRSRFFGMARFYVDPRSGLLRENTKWRSRFFQKPEVKEPLDRIRIDDLREYRLLDGIWYEVELAELAHADCVYDMALRRAASADELVKHYGRRVYAVRKRQLNSKEIRQLPKPQGNAQCRAHSSTML